MPSGWRVAARMLAVVLCYLAALVLCTMPLVWLQTRLPPELVGGPLGLAPLIVPEGAGIAVVLVLTRLLDRRPVISLGFDRRGAARRWWRGAAIGAGMMGAIVLVWYTLVDGARWDVNPDPGRATAAVLVGLLAFLVQGPSEEVLFRGYLLQIGVARWGLWVGVAISSVVFALVHGLNSNFGLLPFVNLLLFGAAAAVYKVLVDGDQLWGVFAIHTVWNWLQQVVFGLENSGSASNPANTLFHVQANTQAPALVWGGGFGPEGTLAATLVLGVLLAAALRTGWRAEASAPPLAEGAATADHG